MSDQSNTTTQDVQASEKLRQHLLDQIHIDKKLIEELSDEELEIVAGGATWGTVASAVRSGELARVEGQAVAKGGSSNIKGYAISLAGGLFGPSLTSLTGK